MIDIVPWPRTDGKEWGVLCLKHPHPEDGPTDYSEESAWNFAHALDCIKCKEGN